jgi:SNF2 family DNA or RNA helicase
MTPSLWQHQQEDLDNSWWLPAAALHWEPRLGKSRLVIETAHRLRLVNRIDAVIVIAPNGVHLNWTRDELPQYWHHENTTVFEWRTGKSGTRRFQDELASTLETRNFVWFACNVEAVALKRLEQTLVKLTKRKRCLLVVDESHYIKSWRANRTRAVFRVSERCPYRRTLTGTPAPQGPFDLWSQFYTLNPEVLGFRFTAFKQRYGVWKRARYGEGPWHDELVEYRNLDDLARRIAPLTFERQKDRCFDLPERLFTRRYFEMPPAHLRVYRALRDDLIAMLVSGDEIVVPLAITKLMRLHQVTRGHVEDHTLEPPHPALEALTEMLEDHSGKVIVWCRFVAEAKMIARHLVVRHGPDSVALCVGETPAPERVELRQHFNDPGSPVRWWVGTIGTGGIGVDLGGASLMIFYSNSFDLAQRLQGLERNYGSSQRAERVEVVDLVAADTVDEKVLATLERKESVAAQLTRESIRNLIT